MLPHIVGNVGFVFTNEDLVEIRDVLLSNKKEAPAKAGAIAPLDVYVPAGNTGMGPEKTSFFQALAIPTKITKGTIEILSDIHLIKVDEKVMFKMQFIPLWVLIFVNYFSAVICFWPKLKFCKKIVKFCLYNCIFYF